MGHPDGAHVHGHDGGSGAGAGLAVLALVILAAIAGPVIAAITSLIEVLMIALAVAVGVAVVGLGGFIAWRLRRDRGRPAPPWQPIQPARRPEIPKASRPAIEQARELHLHLHGVSAEEIAEALRRHEDPADW